MLVWLASYPRSGNTFFRVLLDRLYAVRSYSLGLAPTGPVTAKLGLKPPPSQTAEAVAAAEEVFFAKTHGLPGRDGHPAVYLVRDGRDALVSYAQYTLAFDRGLAPEEIGEPEFRRCLLDLILEDDSPFGTWGSNVESWTRRPNTVVLTFEELTARPSGSVSRVVETLGLPLKPAGGTCPTFTELQAVESRFFRRGRVGSWRDEFPAELLPAFWERFGSMMRKLGYAEAGDAA